MFVSLFKRLSPELKKPLEWPFVWPSLKPFLVGGVAGSPGLGSTWNWKWIVVNLMTLLNSGMQCVNDLKQCPAPLCHLVDTIESSNAFVVKQYFLGFGVLLQNRYLVFIVKANKYKCCSSLCYLNKWIFTSDIASYSYSSFLMVVSNCSVFESWETSTTHYRINCFINFTGEVCPVVFIEKK